MKLLKNQTYYRLTGEIDTAKEDVRVLKLKFEEMQQRKDYLKGEFVRVSDLLDKSKDQQIALNIGLEKTLNENDVLKGQLTDVQDQRSRLVTQLALEIDSHKRLNRMLDEAQDEIKKLWKTINMKEKK